MPDDRALINDLLSKFPVSDVDIAGTYLAEIPEIAAYAAILGFGDKIVPIESEDAPEKPQPIRRPEGNFRKHWIDNVSVTDLRPGDHIRHPSIHYERRIVSIKPHPKGGVQVKTLPSWNYGNRCANPDGKTLKFHITGTASRWDGSTMIEIPR